MYINSIYIGNKDVCNIPVVFQSLKLILTYWHPMLELGRLWKNWGGLLGGQCAFCSLGISAVPFWTLKIELCFLCFLQGKFFFVCICMILYLVYIEIDICLYAVYWKKEPNILKQINSWRKHFRSTFYQDPTFSHVVKTLKTKSLNHLVMEMPTFKAANYVDVVGFMPVVWRLYQARACVFFFLNLQGIVVIN